MFKIFLCQLPSTVGELLRNSISVANKIKKLHCSLHTWRATSVCVCDNSNNNSTHVSSAYCVLSTWQRSSHWTLSKQPYEVDVSIGLFPYLWGKLSYCSKMSWLGSNEAWPQTQIGALKSPDVSLFDHTASYGCSTLCLCPTRIYLLLLSYLEDNGGHSVSFP